MNTALLIVSTIFLLVVMAFGVLAMTAGLWS